jgi:hypothetical protein
MRTFSQFLPAWSPWNHFRRDVAHGAASAGNSFQIDLASMA